VRGNGEEIKDSISKISDVSSVVWKEKGDANEFDIESKDGTDLREEIFKCMVDNNYVLREMRRQTITLEEIFHQITTKETEEETTNA
jgi:ABC-2 type transport system ATP-binding protein